MVVYDVRRFASVHDITEIDDKSNGCIPHLDLHLWNCLYAISRLLVVHDVPGVQNSSAQCGRGDEQLWGGGRTTPIPGLKPIHVPTPDG